jgi:hypothetical protein
MVGARVVSPSQVVVPPWWGHLSGARQPISKHQLYWELPFPAPPLSSQSFSQPYLGPQCPPQGAQASIVDLLLLRGVDVDAQNFRGHTALHFACAFSQQHLADALRAAGARTDIQNFYGASAREHTRGAPRRHRRRREICPQSQTARYKTVSTGPDFP